MGYGFQSINDSGTVQIDETYINYALKSSGTITAGTGFQTFSVSVAGTAPIVCWSGDCFVCCLNSNLNGSTWTFTLATYNGGTFTWYAFDQGAVIGGGGYGLRVYRSDGTLTYDSGNKNLVATTAIAFNTMTASANVSATYTYTSGRKYAVTNLQHPYGSIINVTPGGTPQNPAPVIQQELRYLVSKGLTGSVQVCPARKSSAQYKPVIYPNAGSYGNNASLLVFDITNF